MLAHTHLFAHSPVHLSFVVARYAVAKRPHRGEEMKSIERVFYHPDVLPNSPEVYETSIAASRVIAWFRRFFLYMRKAREVRLCSLCSLARQTQCSSLQKATQQLGQQPLSMLVALVTMSVQLHLPCHAYCLWSYQRLFCAAQALDTYDKLVKIKNDLDEDIERSCVSSHFRFFFGGGASCCCALYLPPRDFRLLLQHSFTACYSRSCLCASVRARGGGGG